MLILDPACGSKMFWFDKDGKDIIFGDIRYESHILCDGRKLCIVPDIQMDFMSMPFCNEQFDMVVFDPPHLKNAGKNGWQAKKYGVLNDDWKQELKIAFIECFRVLKSGGHFIFKWNEEQIKVSEILSLIPYEPLFGNSRPKLSKTHWLYFVKVLR